MVVAVVESLWVAAPEAAVAVVVEDCTVLLQPDCSTASSCRRARIRLPALRWLVAGGGWWHENKVAVFVRRSCE